MERKSSVSMNIGKAIAAAGTSIIAPSGTASAISWPSRRNSSATRASLARTSTISSRLLTIGTNDLVQYLLAADRNNEALGALYTPLHPALLRLLRDVIALAGRRGKSVAVCGEMAADAMFAPLLLALGLGEFSLHPATLLEVRRAIRGCDLGALRARAPALLRARDRAGIERWLSATC